MRKITTSALLLMTTSNVLFAQTSDLTPANVIAQSHAQEWRKLDLDNTLLDRKSTRLNSSH